MSLYGVVAAAIARKIANLIAKIRKLSAAATEKQIIRDAEEEVFCRGQQDHSTPR